MYLGVLSEFVPNVCQLMLNTGTPCVDTGADLQYMSDEPKMSLPSTHTHTHPYTHTHEQTLARVESRDKSRNGFLNPGANMHTRP